MGMLSYIMGHNKPDIAYALNVLSLYCNKPGRCHVEFLLCFVNYYEYSKDDRLKYHAHPKLYDAKTMRGLTQARFQCDADLAGNLDNLHIRYTGHSVVSYKGSQPSEVLAKRGLLILMGFPQDATIIEEDNQECLYASEIPHMS